MMRRQSVQLSLVGMDLSELIPDNLFLSKTKIRAGGVFLRSIFYQQV